MAFKLKLASVMAAIFLAGTSSSAFGQASPSSSPAPAAGDVHPPALGDQQAHPSTVTCKPVRDGHVTVRVRVSPSGDPTRATVEKSSGDPCLDQRTVEAALNHHFQPFMKDGRAVTAELIIDIDMQLKGKDGDVETSDPISIPEGN